MAGFFVRRNPCKHWSKRVPGAVLYTMFSRQAGQKWPDLSKYACHILRGFLDKNPKNRPFFTTQIAARQSPTQRTGLATDQHRFTQIFSKKFCFSLLPATASATASLCSSVSICGSHSLDNHSRLTRCSMLARRSVPQAKTPLSSNIQNFLSGCDKPSLRNPALRAVAPPRKGCRPSESQPKGLHPLEPCHPRAHRP